MKWAREMVAVAAVVVGLPAMARADVVTGRVRQVSAVPIARNSQGKLHVQINEVLFNGAKVAAVVCMNGSTKYYDAWLPANGNSEQRNIMQALLTSSMLAERQVTLWTRWNGSYCEITAMEYK